MQMRQGHYARLVALARRWSRHPDEAEDIVQDALIEALKHDRGELGDARNMKWIAGVIRNSARMQARTAARRKLRDGRWLSMQENIVAPPMPAGRHCGLDGLPRTLKAVAALALTGHNRREIAYLLRISDDALRQRILTLKRELLRRGATLPEGEAGLTMDLAYGRIRKALLSGFERHGGFLASHDPDGHLFFVKRSQTG
jgi:DNA-directed RNA polymerase specialized sigma24 family protein